MLEGSKEFFASEQGGSFTFGREKKEIAPGVKSGRETAKLTQKMFEKAPPRIGAHFVESNVILTMAGLKPNTMFYVPVLDSEDWRDLRRDVQRLNRTLADDGIQIRTKARPRHSPKDDQLITEVEIDNINALERTTKDANIPGVPPFSKERGFEGIDEWRQEKADGLMKAVDEGKIPKKYDIRFISKGIDLGYPDTAIMDHAKAHAEGEDNDLPVANIPRVLEYSSATPNFSFAPEHADDPAIQENIRQATEILNGFYDSPEHKKLKQDERFGKVRGELDRRK